LSEVIQQTLFGATPVTHHHPSRQKIIERVEKLKDEGIAEAEENKKSLVALARKLSNEAALNGLELQSLDDVQMLLVANNISEFALGNAAGRLLAGQKWWKWVREIKSTRPHGHGNRIGLYRFLREVYLKEKDAEIQQANR
jgi:hypothetical protein